MLTEIQKKYPDFKWVIEENLAPPPSLEIICTIGGEHLQRKWCKAVAFKKEKDLIKNKEMILNIADKIVNIFLNSEERI